MKKVFVIWAFLFLMLVLLTAEAIDSNRAELTHRFSLHLNLPLGQAYETAYAPNVAEYFGLCILLGGAAVTLLALGGLLRAHHQVRVAKRALEEAQAELRRLRGPAEHDEVYQSKFDAK